MKKHFLGAGILSLAALPCAYGQSSVTLYGVVEEGIAYTSNVNSHGDSLVAVNSGVLYGERLGFKGVEDLGNGLRTIFILENGFTSSNGKLGQGGLLFGRQAFVGLDSAHYGTLTFGKQFDSIANLANYGSGLLYNGYYTTHMGDFDHLGGERTNNSVKYATPSFYGFKVEALYGLGGQPGSVAQDSTYGIAATYLNGNFSLAAAAMSVKNATVDLNGSFGIGSFEGVPLAAGKNGALTSTVLQSSSQAIFGVGSSYTIGNATLTAVVTQVDSNNSFAVGQRFGDIIARFYEASVSYFITPSFMFGVNDTYTKLQSDRWNTTGAAIHYFLSKRTDVYAVAAYEHAMGTAQSSDILLAGGVSSSINQMVGRVGIRHRF